MLSAIISSALSVSGQSLQDSIRALDEVVVRRQRSLNKISTTSSVQVLSKDDIRSLGLQNVADAVRRFAGTNVRDYGGIGGLKTVSVRNLGAAHTAVSYDGVAVSNCQAGQIDIGRFSLDNVSTLSLAIGNDDNLLQSARLYASAGVLNIATERPTFANGSSHSTQVMLRGGSYGYVAPSLRHWQRLGQRTSLAADFSYMRADGNYKFELQNGSQTTTEKRSNSDIYMWQGEANLYHSFADGGELDAKAYYFYSERGLPGSVVLYNSISRERLWDENFFAQTRYNKDLSEHWSLLAQAKYNYSWNRYEDTDVKYESGKEISINRQNEYYLSAAVSYRATNALSLSLAQDGAINTLHTSVDLSPNPIRYTSLTALTAAYRQGPVKLQGTLLGTFITEDVKAGIAPDNRQRLSPTASLSVKPFGDEDFYLRAMYKSTFRVPTFNDLYYLRSGNTSLRPEKATEYTAGLTWSGRLASWMDYLTLTLDGYYNVVDDKIVAFPTTYVWKMQNYGKVHITGIDITAATAFTFMRDYRLSLSANYSWQRAIDVTDPSAKNYRDQLPYTPEHSGNASLSIETPWVNVGYTLTAVGRRYYLAQNLPENEIGSYTEHTATLWREFKFGPTSLRLQGEIINFTNTQYDIIKYYPMPGRNWRLTAIIKF